MKDSVKEIIKSVIISILAVIAIILLVIVFSYNKVALGRIVPKPEKYELSEDTKLELESEDEEQTEVITTYILDAAELNYYERTKEYNKGKRHPFAEDTTSTTAGNNQTSGGGDSYSGNFYEDEGK